MNSLLTTRDQAEFVSVVWAIWKQAFLTALASAQEMQINRLVPGANRLVPGANRLVPGAKEAKEKKHAA